MVIRRIEDVLRRLEKQKLLQKFTFFSKTYIRNSWKKWVFEEVFAFQVVVENFLRVWLPCLKWRSNTIQLKIAKLFGFQFESCVSHRNSSQNSFYLRLNSFVLVPKVQEKIRSINIKPTIILEDTFLTYSQFLPYFEQKVQNFMKMN